MANYEAHARTRTVGPRTQQGLDRKEQATSHSKNTSMYVAMLISVTKASMQGLKYLFFNTAFSREKFCNFTMAWKRFHYISEV